MKEQHEFCDQAKQYNWEAVKRSINSNPAFVNVQACGHEGKVRWSALHQAAHDGNASAMRFLLEHGANVDAKSWDGKTPMDVAKNAGVKAVLAKLIGLPTPVRAKGTTGKSVSSMKVKKVTTKRKSKIAKGKRAKALVYNGKFQKTTGGLTKEHVTKNKAGKVVSVKMQAHGKKAYIKNGIQRWVAAFLDARVELGVTGFVAIKNGSDLHKKTKEIYEA